ncbi:MAG: hypothetical protein ACOC2N_07635 [Spirochaetota bacterium]
MLVRSALFSAITITLLFAGCATDPDPVVVVVDEPEREPVPEPEPEPEGVEAEPEIAVEEPEPEPVVEEPTGPIEVPEHLYNQAFSEVESLIGELNEIIYRGQFETWKSYLTDRYLEYHSDPDVLRRISQQPILAQNNIKLRSLHDYFEDVVIPSRARARLDDLIFYSDSLVEAVTEFRGQRVILYLLRKIDGEWKIDTTETPPSEETPENG